MGEVKELVERLRERFAFKALPPCHICGAAMVLAQAGGGSLPMYRCGAFEGDYTDEASRHWIASTLYHYDGDADVITLLDTLQSQERRIGELEAGLERIVADCRLAADALGNSGDEFASFERSFRIIGSRARSTLTTGGGHDGQG